MDYEMETIIQALVIQINMVWNQFHEIIHELIRYAHALGPSTSPGTQYQPWDLHQPIGSPERFLNCALLCQDEIWRPVSG